MPRYSDELVNEIFAQNDIVDYVSQYVRLRKNGRDYTGLCPFHKEKSPSFRMAMNHATTRKKCVRLWATIRQPMKRIHLIRSFAPAEPALW